jgi:protein-disulfide isomerase
MVLGSRYSSIHKIPLAGLGFIYYVYLLLALIYARFSQESAPRALALPFIFTLGSVGLSLFLAYISLFVLQSFCVFCTSLYVVNILLVILMKKIFSPLSIKKIFQLIPWKKSLAYFSILFAVGITTLYSGHKQFAKEPSDSTVRSYVRKFFKQPKTNIQTTDRPFWGNPHASIVVVEFSDFECPACRIASFNLKPLLGDYKENIKFVFLNYPLDPSCNPNMPRPLHDHACVAAYGGVCAHAQGQFWKYHDQAFRKQPKLDFDSLVEIAKKMKLNVAAFKKCLNDPNTKSQVLKDLEEGTKADVQGTPSLYINGRPMPYWSSKKILTGIIKQFLQNPSLN